MGLITDRIYSWLNGRDENAVQGQLEIVDAANAEGEMLRQAMKVTGDERQARKIIAEAKGHEREIDIAPSDADPYDDPIRRERTEIDRDDLEAAEALADEVQ